MIVHGLLACARFDDDVEVGAGCQPGWIPPGGGRVVGDRRERTGHALRTNADGVTRLRGGGQRRKDEYNECGGDERHGGSGHKA